MLSLTLNRQHFVTIGGTVLRISDIRGDKVRVAIFASPEIPIHRLDEDGKMKTGRVSSEEMARVESIVAEAFKRGPVPAA